MVSVASGEAAVKLCAYCGGDMPRDPAIPEGKVSHGMCEACALEHRRLEGTDAPQVCKCASCATPIGAWRSVCVPCEREGNR